MALTDPNDPDLDELGLSRRFLFSSLGDLRAQFPEGDYLFEFNGGTTSTTLNFANLEPPGFVDITSPLHESTTTSTPTLSWEICPACGTVDADLLLFLDDQTLVEDGGGPRP